MAYRVIARPSQMADRVVTRPKLGTALERQAVPFAGQRPLQTPTFARACAATTLTPRHTGTASHAAGQRRQRSATVCSPSDGQVYTTWRVGGEDVEVRLLRQVGNEGGLLWAMRNEAGVGVHYYRSADGETAEEVGTYTEFAFAQEERGISLSDDEAVVYWEEGDGTEHLLHLDARGGSLTVTQATIQYADGSTFDWPGHDGAVAILCEAIGYHGGTLIAGTYGTDAPHILRSTDRGRTWTVVDTVPQIDGAAGHTHSVRYHAGTGTWVIARGDGVRAGLRVSTDDGLTWDWLDPFPLDGVAISAGLCDAGHSTAVLCGQHGARTGAHLMWVDLVAGTVREVGAGQLYPDIDTGEVQGIVWHDGLLYVCQSDSDQGTGGNARETRVGIYVGAGETAEEASLNLAVYHAFPKTANGATQGVDNIYRSQYIGRDGLGRLHFSIQGATTSDAGCFRISPAVARLSDVAWNLSEETVNLVPIEHATLEGVVTADVVDRDDGWRRSSYSNYDVDIEVTDQEAREGSQCIHAAGQLGSDGWIKIGLTESDGVDLATGVHHLRLAVKVRGQLQDIQVYLYNTSTSSWEYAAKVRAPATEQADGAASEWIDLVSPAIDVGADHAKFAIKWIEVHPCDGIDADAIEVWVDAVQLLEGPADAYHGQATKAADAESYAVDLPDEWTHVIGIQPEFWADQDDGSDRYIRTWADSGGTHRVTLYWDASEDKFALMRTVGGADQAVVRGEVDWVAKQSMLWLAVSLDSDAVKLRYYSGGPPVDRARKALQAVADSGTVAGLQGADAATVKWGDSSGANILPCIVCYDELVPQVLTDAELAAYCTAAAAE